jgi:hypothetical protein
MADNESPDVNAVADALAMALISPNEADRNGEHANVVDGLFAIARALDRVAVALEKSNIGAPRPDSP